LGGDVGSGNRSLDSGGKGVDRMLLLTLLKRGEEYEARRKGRR